ncbi:bifunctional DNA primase/polymerase [Nocardia sp. XZ_19_385]|uniref:bifunctional DNA primase/polymerase n=1 Tax=Nocardia sp. XZ_19_385 TaxID=2769488 RepID=UPI00188DE37B|nr:bifunctional DNA primase/polymerase [Nocardia sp. XZ_19_385]
MSTAKRPVCAATQTGREWHPYQKDVPRIMSNSTASGSVPGAALLDHALAYARVGLAVLPLTPQGKAPASAHGKDDATTDPAQIRAWWLRNSHCNIGIRPYTGVVVLDVDPRSGGSLDALGQIPETWTAATGGGGWHLWFRCGGKVRGKLDGTPGVDIKTHTGYLVAPPSVHPTGTGYEWTNRAPIAALPSHLDTRVRVPAVLPFPAAPFSRHRGSVAGLVNAVQKAAEGQRNQVLFWAASRVCNEGGNPAALRAISDAAEGCGLSRTEIERTIRSAQRGAA